MSTIHWTEGSVRRSARWHAENGTPLPRRTVVVDDRTRADDACRHACAGTALLWRGDFHNARHLLQAMGRRIDRIPPTPGTFPAETYRLHRRDSGHRARVLGRLLVLLDDDYGLALRRAPDVRRACLEAYGPPKGPMAVSLRELLGVTGAHQWRLKGVEVPVLGARVHPHYGVFAPVRGEYVDLVAEAPLPPAVRCAPADATAFDLGTGTGVLAAVLARRGIGRVVATDISPRALACAEEERPAARTHRPCPGVGPRPVPGRPRRPRRVQPALDAGPSDRPCRAGRLPSGRRDAPRFPRRARRPSPTGRRGLARPVRPGGTPRPADTRAPARRRPGGSPARGGQDRHQAPAPALQGHHRPAPRGAPR